MIRFDSEKEKKHNHLPNDKSLLAFSLNIHAVTV